MKIATPNSTRQSGLTLLRFGRLAITIALLPLAGCPAPQDDVGVVKGTQFVGTQAASRDRGYTLHVPAAFQQGVPMPVVLLFHPIGGGGRQFLDGNGWTELAERAGFIAVAPDGLGLDPSRPISLTNLSGWSATQISFGGATNNYDVLFFDTILADLSLKLGFPVERVFVAGHSEGGSLGFVLASERGANVRALAPVASHWIGIGPSPQPSTPTFFIVGTDDPFAPLTGGSGLTPSIDFTLSRWALALGCGLTPATTFDDGALRTVEYSQCGDGATFRATFITGQGHRWPGGQGLLNLSLGADSGRLNATAAIWAFFEEQIANGR